MTNETKNFLLIFMFFALILFSGLIFISPSSAGFYSGKIYLQVEKNGEAWYVYPVDNHRYYLGRPNDAFNIMRNLGLGISNENLSKIPVGVLETFGTDSDNDGLSNDMEIGLGTDPYNPDTDNDDFADSSEIENGYSPFGPGKIAYNYNLVKQLEGRILLQVERNGEAWYLNPTDQKRYFLGRPADAFEIMRQLGIGITNSNLNNIAVNYTRINKELANKYTIKYPDSWTYSEVFEPKYKYENVSIYHEATLTPEFGGGYLKIYTLEDLNNHTLGDFDIAKIANTYKLANENFYIGDKPVLKQKFKYDVEVQKGNDFFDNGAELMATIMIDTKNFIHFHMKIFNEADIYDFENQFNYILKNIQLIY